MPKSDLPSVYVTNSILMPPHAMSHDELHEGLLPLEPMQDVKGKKFIVKK